MQCRPKAVRNKGKTKTLAWAFEKASFARRCRETDNMHMSSACWCSNGTTCIANVTRRQQTNHVVSMENVAFSMKAHGIQHESTWHMFKVTYSTT